MQIPHSQLVHNFWNRKQHRLRHRQPLRVETKLLLSTLVTRLRIFVIVARIYYQAQILQCLVWSSLLRHPILRAVPDNPWGLCHVTSCHICWKRGMLHLRRWWIHYLMHRARCQFDDVSLDNGNFLYLNLDDVFGPEYQKLFWSSAHCLVLWLLP